MRWDNLVMACVLMSAGCDDLARRPAGALQETGITTATDTGEGDSGDEAPGPKLDLPADDWDQTTGGDETTDVGAAETTTGGESTTGSSGDSSGAQGTTAGDETSSTGDELSTTGDESTSGESSTGSTGGESSGGSSSTGGEPEPEPEPAPFCGDGVCDDSEHASGCWTPGWCKVDCAAAPACASDCPCTPGITSWCELAPGTCDATKPGGTCDPNGDGAYFDGDWTAGWYSHAQKCG